MAILDQPQDPQHYPQQQPMYPFQPDTKSPAGPSQDFHWFRLSGADIVDDIQHRLNGELQVMEKGELKWRKKYNAWLNERGINDVVSSVAWFLNKNIYLGNLNHQEIYDRCRDFMKYLAYLIMRSYVIWELPKAKRDLLLDMIIGQVHSALSRSEMGNEARQLSTAISRIEQSHVDQKPQQPSIFNPARYLGRMER